MKSTVLIFAFHLVSINTVFAQISSRDTANFDFEKFANIYRLEISFTPPDSSFKSLQFENGVENNDSVKIIQSVFPMIFEETVVDFKRRTPFEGQKILFRGFKTIGNIRGFFIESEFTNSNKEKSIVLFFSIPHEYGSINLKAVYPKSLDKDYRKKLLYSFSSVKYHLREIN